MQTLTLAQRKEVVQLYVSGKSLNYIAELYDVTPACIHYWCTKANCVMRPRGGPNFHGKKNP